MSPLVSIIIPIYNSEKFLSECINSIVNQLYVNWELLLIDDGSMDGSSEIAKQWESKDKRIKYFRKENGGVSSARNFGIDKAAGEYLMFVDSDDICAPNIIQLMMDNVKSNIDLVCCKIQRFENAIPFDDVDVSSVSLISYSSLDELYCCLSEQNLLNPPFGKLFRRSIINEFNIRYNQDLALGEDFCFNLNYLDHIHSGAMIFSVMYFYRDTIGSLSKTIKGDYADIQMLLFDRKYDFTTRHHISCALKATEILRDTFLSLCHSTATTKEKITSIDRLKQHKMLKLRDNNISMKDFILFCFIRYIPSAILIKIFR